MEHTCSLKVSASSCCLTLQELARLNGSRTAPALGGLSAKIRSCLRSQNCLLTASLLAENLLCSEGGNNASREVRLEGEHRRERGKLQDWTQFSPQKTMNMCLQSSCPVCFLSWTMQEQIRQESWWEKRQENCEDPLMLVYPAK